VSQCDSRDSNPAGFPPPSTLGVHRMNWKLRVAAVGAVVLMLAMSARGQETTQSIAPEEPESASNEQVAARTLSNGNVWIVAANWSLDRVAQKLSEATSTTVFVRGKANNRRVDTLILRDVPFDTAITRIVNLFPDLIVHRPDDKTVEIWDQESYRAEVLPKSARQKVFVPRHITAEELHKAISGVLTPNIGRAAYDPRSNKVFVTDLPSVLELIQRLMEEIDISFVSRVFHISNGDVSEIAENLANLKSPAAPPPIVSERTRQIIVQDRLDKIREMELLVEILDVGDLGPAAGTPLLRWRAAGIEGDELLMRDEKGKQVKIKRGEPVRFHDDRTGKAAGRLTLKYLPDKETSIPGRVAVFTIERDPIELEIPVP